MLEIVFSQSACGSLRQAGCFGRGKAGGVGGVFAAVTSGAAPTEEDIAEARRQAEERFRKEWEQARPLDVRRRDIHCFSLALSVGDLSEDMPGPIRRAVIQALLSGLPETDEVAGQFLEDASTSLETVLRQSAAGETVRIWYSDVPDELCGLYWLLAQLDGLGENCGPIRMVRLPRWEQREDGTVAERNGWGEVGPGEWGGLCSGEEPVSPVLRRSCAACWQRLRAENAPLRAVLNGRLVSAPADVYDSFLRRELEQCAPEFQEARLIGTVLSRWQLGISDGLLANRIEAMIAAGELEAVTQPEEGYPRYHRILRKKEVKTLESV